MTLSIVIPWRTDHGQRQRILDWALPRWEAFGYEVVLGAEAGEGPFSCAQAVNDGVRRSSGDLIVLFGADHVPDHAALRRAEERLAVLAWAPLYSDTAVFSIADTEAILRGADPDDFTPEVSVPVCTGILAFHRSVYDEAGGWDERFHGWGCEDTAFRTVLEALHGRVDPGPHQLRGLWHPPAPRDRFDANCELLSAYIGAEGDPDAMRALIDERKWTP